MIKNKYINISGEELCIERKLIKKGEEFIATETNELKEMVRSGDLFFVRKESEHNGK